MQENYFLFFSRGKQKAKTNYSLIFSKKYRFLQPFRRLETSLNIGRIPPIFLSFLKKCTHLTPKYKKNGRSATPCSQKLTD